MDNNVDFLEDCALIIDGSYVTDWGPGRPIKVNYKSDRINPMVGADGSVAIAEVNDNSAEITVNVKQTSPINSILSKLSTQKKKFPVVFEDSNNAGSVVASSGGCRVIKYAEVERGNEVTERQWVIFAPNLQVEE